MPLSPTFFETLNILDNSTTLLRQLAKSNELPPAKAQQILDHLVALLNDERERLRKD